MYVEKSCAVGTPPLFPLSLTFNFTKRIRVGQAKGSVPPQQQMPFHPQQQQTTKMNAGLVTMVVNEMTEYWNQCPQGGEDEDEFRKVLHDPEDEETMSDAIRDMCLACPDFTDAQWREVLVRLRAQFPLDVQDGDADGDDKDKDDE